MIRLLRLLFRYHSPLDIITIYRIENVIKLHDRYCPVNKVSSWKFTDKNHTRVMVDTYWGSTIFISVYNLVHSKGHF